MVDLARDGRHFLLLRARPDRVQALLRGDDGVPLAEPVAIDSTLNTGEKCAVSAATDGKWVVAWGTWTSDMGDAWFGTVSARVVTVSP